MDRLQAMSVFVSVAELRGFAPAARRLGLAPSAVTRLVAALEEHLGTRLLQRTTRSVTLTDAGTRYLERARRILGDVAEAEGAARVERAVPTGRLVVTAPAVFGRLHVAPLMCAFLEQYPATTGELSLSDRSVNLVEDGVDLAVRIGELDDSSYVARPVGLVRRIVVGSPQYLARHARPRAPADVAGHSLIQFTALNATPEWRLVVNGAIVRAPFVPRYVTNSADAAVGHAERGGGLAMVLSYQAAESLAAGRLEIVLEDFEPAPLPIQIVYPTTRLLSAKVRAFVELCTKACTWDFTFRAKSSRGARRRRPAT